MKNTTALFLVIIAIALTYTFTSPYYEKVKVLQASVQDYRNVLDNLARIAETRDELLLEYEQIPQIEINRLGKILPDNVDTVKIAQELDSVAARYGIALKDVRVGEISGQDASLPVLPENAKPHGKVQLSFSFIATYENFRRFLGDLEKNLRIMDMRSAAFQTGESNLSEYRLMIETYWLK